MLGIAVFLISIGAALGATAVLDIVAIKKANKVTLERPDLIELEG